MANNPTPCLCGAVHYGSGTELCGTCGRPVYPVRPLKDSPPAAKKPSLLRRVLLRFRLTR